MGNNAKSASAIPTTPEEVTKLLRRAHAGDASALPVLRELLRSPKTVEALGGNLARQAEYSLIGAAAGENLAAREAMLRKLELLRAELAGPNPTPIEQLLVERVTACWLQVQDADVRYAQAKDLSIPWGEYYQRRMDRAHRRYLSAIRTLTLVRNLAVPVLKPQKNATNVPLLPTFADRMHGQNGYTATATSANGHS